MIMEDEVQSWHFLLSMIPMARTPQDKKSSKSIIKAIKEISKSIRNSLAPWIEKRRIEALRKRLKQPPKGVVYNEDGTVVDLSDPNLWKMESD